MKRTSLRRKTPLRATHGKPLVRKSRLKSGGRLKVKGKRRFPKGSDPKYRLWVAQRGCFFWGLANSYCHIMALTKDGMTRWSEPAHIKTKGSGGTDLGNLLPMCNGHHAEQHRIGIKSFAKKYGIDLQAEATRLAAAYLNEQGETK